MERRLVAILAADVVGYSSMMGNDEAGTLSALKAHRSNIFDPQIEKHGGRIIKLMGDGTLVEFASIVDAVNCAVAIQTALAETDGPIRLRIGINIGDIIVEGDDIYGDGVNVAARLEGLADEGGICVSRDVFNQVRSKTDVKFDDLGEKRFKNIANPVQVFSVTLDGTVSERGPGGRLTTKNKRQLTIGTVLVVILLGVAANYWHQSGQPREEPANTANMAFPLPEKPSIAVLPFNNMSGEASQEYFADGMTEDLITDLSKISGLFVIARNSSFTYKGKAVKVGRVAEELGVRYVLEGSVRRSGDQVRINAQLIDATSGGHLWAERYDGSNADVFALQDQVTGQIVKALALTLTPQEKQNVSDVETSNAEAHDAYLLGLSFYHRRTAQDNSAAGIEFEKAIAIDPQYTAAYAALAKVYVQGLLGRNEYSLKLGFGWFDGTAKTWKLLDKIQASPSSDYYVVRSRLALRRHQTETAIAEARKALELNSNDAEAMEALSEALIFAGDVTEGANAARRALRQSPTRPARAHYLLGLAKFSKGDLQEAIRLLRIATRLAPDERNYFGILASALGELGNSKDAEIAFAEFKETPDALWTLHQVVAQYPFAAETVLERFALGLTQAGVPTRTARYLPLHRENRLAGHEIRELLFGRQIDGKRFWDGAMDFPWQQMRTPAGTVVHSGYNIQPGVRNGEKGQGKIIDNLLCENWPKLAQNIDLCFAIYRVTGRIERIKWGDYVMVTDTGPHPFSLAK